MLNVLLLGLLVASPILAAPTATSSSVPASTTAADGSYLAYLTANYTKNTLPLIGTKGSNCTKANLSIRKNWANLTTIERTSYLNAVKCMNQKPSQVDPAVVPGARNRLDDFTYSHINQTDFIHESGLLLPWHRQFLWAFEHALQTECGFNGTVPYWDFSAHANNQSQSPVFDGSATSFGGDGEYVPHSGGTATLVGLPTPATVYRPAGSGGGCVKNGGLVSGSNNTFTVNLGPVAPANNPPNDTYGYDYNPRCLSRDFYGPLSSYNLSWAMTNKLMSSPDINVFRPSIDNDIHPAAHQFVGKDLYDLYSSPSDPVFYLLHSQIDRLWTVWQGQDYAGRGLALNGTDTFANDPPSPPTTLSTIMIMHLAGGDIPVHYSMSAIGQGSQYCYMYQ